MKQPAGKGRMRRLVALTLAAAFAGTAGCGGGSAGDGGATGGAERGEGPGATRGGRLDYVFYRGALRLEAVEVVRETVSDHRPVVAGFAG